MSIILNNVPKVIILIFTILKCLKCDNCTIENHAYMVSIYVNRDLFCSGTLMTFNWVLTAAECCQEKYKNEYYNIYTGSFTAGEGKPNEVLLKFSHPNFEESTGKNSMCLMKLKKPILQNSKIAYIKYALTDTKCSDGKVIFFNKVKLTAECLDGKLLKSCSGNIFCISTSMHGESNEQRGAPFMCNDVQYGILSSGSGTDDNPYVFTDVADYHEFIFETIKKNSCGRTVLHFFSTTFYFIGTYVKKNIF